MSTDEQDNRESLEKFFPKLRSEAYQVTSPVDPRYNCAAFAAGDHSRWWGMPFGNPKYFWPPGVSNDETVEDWMKAFRMLNFEPCDSTEPEPGCDKIAIYGVNRNDATHVAIQMDGTQWMSKLGEMNDIAHLSPQTLECDESHTHVDCYGTVHVIMRRRRSK